MKKIICVEPNQFAMTNVTMPDVKPGEALIRIRRIGICGTDIHAYHGNQPFFTYPRVLGHELSGTIEMIGSGEGNLSIGDQVSVIPYLHCGICVACRKGKTNCCTNIKVIGVHVDGGLAEFISMPTNHLIRTNGLSIEQSAVIEPLGIGAHAVRRSGVCSGDTVLVVGGGPIGLGVMAFAKLRGAHVIAMDINEERLAFCTSWADVDATIDARIHPEEELSRLTDGEFPTVVFDATGNAISMSASVQYVAHGGTLVYVGLVKGDVCFSDPELHKRELTLMGSRNATLEDFNAVRSAMENGLLDVNGYVTHRIKFNHVMNEFEALTKPEAKVVKAMIELE
ncbi:zinc-binding alcohol dehydrogenase family protein [Alicyclobacillus fodiniaquatilis]|uniref:Zinc-binding alcohol dehydrogenase family protein n=1 Tax=Alicyclobacillus fodiniaquatilis TaxID=1661150 RepID=A0ABW4JHY2_9BACL